MYSIMSMVARTVRTDRIVVGSDNIQYVVESDFQIIDWLNGFWCYKKLQQTTTIHYYYYRYAVLLLVCVYMMYGTEIMTGDNEKLTIMTTIDK